MPAGIIEIDLHNRNKTQARTAIDAALRRADRGTYRLRIIHGYNRGTELKEMLLEEYSSHPLVLRIQSYPNKGQTDLILREL